MESDVDADDFILLGDAVRGDSTRDGAPADVVHRASSSGGHGDDDDVGDVGARPGHETVDAAQLADSLQWYQAETEKLTRQVIFKS